MANNVRTTGQLGLILKQLRQAKGWSQIELGKKIGLSQERISVIESHPERISLDQLLTVLMALDAELQVDFRNSSSPNELLKTVKRNLKTKHQEPW